MVKYSKFDSVGKGKQVLHKEIETKLAQFRDPYSNQDLISAKALKSITIEANQIDIDIVLGYPHLGVQTEMLTALHALLAPVDTSKTLNIKLSSSISAHTGKSGIAALPQVKNIIAVASGKGGVGKSTVAVNLAHALVKEGARVGILDADIYGPSQPTMLGTVNQKPVIENRTIQPIERHGLQSMSIGYLVDPSAAMVWRGPMLGKALEQLIHDTQWHNLDYLIVDLPPGTGDVQLTLCQKIPVSGAVVVTTPQDLALMDVRRACEMFNKLNVPILGVVENMSTYHCDNCGHQQALFGAGGGDKLAQEFQIQLLGQVPLHQRIREISDAGEALIALEPDSAYTKTFLEIARYAAAKLALQNKDYSSRFPKIVVEQKKN